MDILSHNSLDAVVISTPAEMHCRMARDALLANKHVIVEKPLASNGDQGEELLVEEGELGKINISAQTG